MEQGQNKKKRTFVQIENLTDARELLNGIRYGSSTRADINRLNEEMYKSSEVSSIITRLLEKTCRTFEDGRTMRAIAENGEETLQNYINQLIVDFGVEDRLAKQTICLYTKGEVMARLVSVEALETKKHIFQNPPTEEQLLEVQEKVSKIKNRHVLIRTIEDIENPLEYYDLQSYGQTVKFIKNPLQNNDWLMGGVNSMGDLLAIAPHVMVHKTLYPRLTSERIATGEYDGYGEPVELQVNLGKGLLESAYPAFVDYMLDKAANQTAKDARNTVINLIQIQSQDMNDDEKDQVVDAILDKLTTRKSISDVGGISEYTSATQGPAVVVTTKDGETGSIDASQVGGDYDAGAMTDTKFYQTVLYGAFRAIKQEFGILDDNAGFSGGDTLENIQSAERDMIKLAQRTICSLWEEIFNRYLESVGMHKYLGMFRLEMNKPKTKGDADEDSEREAGIRNAEQLMQAVEGKSKESLKLFRTMLNLMDMPSEVLQALDEIIEDSQEELGEDNDRDELDDMNDIGDMGEHDSPSPRDAFGDEGLEEDIEESSDSPQGKSSILDSLGDELKSAPREPKHERLPSFNDDDMAE